MGGPRNLLLLVTLVIAAASSGYLWRAALESPHVRTVVRVAPPAATKSTVTVTPKQAAHLQATTRKPRRRHRSLGAQLEAVASAPLASPAAAVVTSPPRPAPKPKPKTGSPSPPPSPAPKPKPPPTATTPEPPRAPEPKPKPAAPPPPTTTTTPSPPGEQRPPHEEKKPVSDGQGQKPGWGKGDENHDHGGPPGRRG